MMYKGERLNSITHLIGAVLALIGMILLVVPAISGRDVWRIVSFSIYGISLCLLYTSSTMYHSLYAEKAKKLFRKFDYLSIYLLIAGTYTPFTLLALQGGLGWTVFISVWCMAIFGIVLVIWDPLPKKWKQTIPVLTYLFMGWFIFVAIVPLVRNLPSKSFILLLFGGLSYTIGVIFFSLDEKIRHFHGVWHLFVLIGSINHYFSIFFYLT